MAPPSGQRQHLHDPGIRVRELYSITFHYYSYDTIDIRSDTADAGRWTESGLPLHRYLKGNGLALDITFGNRKLGKNLNEERRLMRAYGARMARTIKLRLAVLRNASTLSEVRTDPPERRHQLSGNRSGQYAVDLIHPRRLIFEPNHKPLPLRADGGIDTDQVTVISIIEVTDYHR